MKRTAIFLCGLVAILMIAGCAPTAEPESTQTAEITSQTQEPVAAPTLSTPAVALVLTQEDAFNQEFAAQTDAALAKQGYRSLVYYSNTPQEQYDNIYQAIADSADAVILLPRDMDNLQVALEECETQGIPVINVMVPINGIVQMLISPDYQKMGAVAAQHAMAARPEGARVLLLESGSGFVSQLVHDGFVNEIKEQESIKVAEARITDGTVEDAAEQTKQALEKDAAINLVFAETEENALGAVQAAQEKGADVKIIARGGSAAMMQAVKDGQVYASVFASPKELAERAVYYAMEASSNAETALPQYDGLVIETILSEDVERYRQSGNYAHVIAPYVVGAPPVTDEQQTTEAPIIAVPVESATAAPSELPSASPDANASVQQSASPQA